jgi:histidyl-tRNA synthetase
MRYADKIFARYVIVIGDDELKSGIITVKDMQKSLQGSVKVQELVAYFTKDS